VRDYRDLRVWRKSHELVLDVYRETRSFPAEERYGLTAQIRRSAGSVPSNIAEGCGRSTEPDFQRFLSIGSGSNSEFDYQLLLSHDLGYLNEKQYPILRGKTAEVRRMLRRIMGQT